MGKTHSMTDIAKHIKFGASKRIHSLKNFGLTLSFLPRQGPVDRIKMSWYNNGLNDGKNVGILHTKKAIGLENVIKSNKKNNRPLWILHATTPLAKRKTKKLASILGLRIQNIELLNLPNNVLSEIMKKMRFRNVVRFAQTSKTSKRIVQNINALPTKKELDSIKKKIWNSIHHKLTTEEVVRLFGDKGLKNLVHKYRTLDSDQFDIFLQESRPLRVLKVFPEDRLLKQLESLHYPIDLTDLWQLKRQNPTPRSTFKYEKLLDASKRGDINTVDREMRTLLDTVLAWEINWIDPNPVAINILERWNRLNERQNARHLDKIRPPGGLYLNRHYNAMYNYKYYYRGS